MGGGTRKGREAPSGQLNLTLDFDVPAVTRLKGPLPLMTPSVASAPFDDDDYFFEPWWPGARALALVDSDGLRLSTDHLADPLATFPELGVIASQVAADVVLDGTLLVLDDEGRPDAELLRSRLSTPLSSGGEAAFVASDLLFADGRPLLDEPFSERHSRLGQMLKDGRLCVASRGLRGEGMTLAAAVASMGLAQISARRLSGRYHAGDAGQDWIRAPVIGTPASETRPLLVLLNRLPLD